MALRTRRTDRFVDKNEGGIWIDDVVDAAKKKKFINGFKSLEKMTYADVVQYLNNDKKNNPEMQTAWSVAENLYRNEISKRSLPSPLKELQEERKIAIVVYTLADPPIYREFNRLSRELFITLDWDKFPFKGLWLMLFGQASLFKSSSSHPNFVYRGIDKPYHVEVGKKITFFQGTSVTAKKEEAEKFTGNGNGTLLVMKWKKGLGIKELSQFPYEEEYLLLPNTTFTVKSITKKTSYKEIHLE